MKNRFASTLLIACCLGSTVCAQTSMPDRSRPAGFRDDVLGLGFTAGPAGGLGISFRHHLRTPFSYQITGGIIKADKRLMYDLGAEIQYDFSRSPDARYYVGGATGYFFSGQTARNDMAGPGRLGFGLGGEFTVSPTLCGAVELLFTYFTDGTILPLPQAGIYYYF